MKRYAHAVVDAQTNRHPKNMKTEPIAFLKPNLWAFLIIRANAFQAEGKNDLLVRAIYI